MARNLQEEIDPDLEEVFIRSRTEWLFNGDVRAIFEKRGDLARSTEPIQFPAEGLFLFNIDEQPVLDTVAWELTNFSNLNGEIVIPYQVDRFLLIAIDDEAVTCRYERRVYQHLELYGTFRLVHYRSYPMSDIDSGEDTEDSQNSSESSGGTDTSDGDSGGDSGGEQNVEAVGEVPRVANGVCGHVASLLPHMVGSGVVEHLGTAAQKQQLLAELYSTELQLFKGLTSAIGKRVVDIMAMLGLQKSLVNQHMTASVQPILEKGIVDLSIIHKLLIEYLTTADKNGRRPLLELLHSNYFSHDDLSVPSLCSMVAIGGSHGILCSTLSEKLCELKTETPRSEEEFRAHPGKLSLKPDHKKACLGFALILRPLSLRKPCLENVGRGHCSEIIFAFLKTEDHKVREKEVQVL